MPNVIKTITKYLPVLDEQYRLGSKSAILDTPKEFVRATKSAKKFEIAKVSTDGLANYDKNTGFVNGDTTLEWEEHTYTQDRGRSLSVDAVDNIETMGIAFGKLAGTFQGDHVIPELDAYRFTKYFKGAGITLEEAAISATNILSLIDNLSCDMDDAEVPENGRIMFLIPSIYKLMINDDSIKKQLTVNDSLTKALNKKIYEYNEMPIIKVPSARMYEDIKLNDGKTHGQEKGGYAPATPETKHIPLMIIHKSAIIQVSKRLIARFWAPTRKEADAEGADGVNPNADAWKFDFRVYHDCWILENKKKGIAALKDTSVSA